MKRIFSFLADYTRETDKIMLILSFVASAFGCLAVTSATAYTGNPRQALTQLFAMFAGIGIAVVISVVDYHKLQRFWYLIAAAGLIPVFLTFFIGYAPEGTDDKAWLLLPGNVSFQPAEFLKICFIITFSTHLAKVKAHINKPLNLLFLALHGAFPVALIHFQGDDGTAIVFAAVFVCMMFVAGVKLRYFIIAFSLILVAAPFVFFFLLSEDQKARILYLFDLESNLQGIGFQQWMGRVALANGGIFGQGLFRGELTQVQGVPEGHNDFIFVSIGEEMGMVGCFAVLLLLSCICLRCVRVARISSDESGMYVASGVFAMLCTQTVINIGMCTSLLPVIGVTLPFFSAGGSSLLCLMVAVGVMLSVYKHRNTGTIYLHE